MAPVPQDSHSVLHPLQETGAAIASPVPPGPPLDYGSDTKLPLSLLMRLQMWIQAEFKSLDCSLLIDVNNLQYIQVRRSTPHSLLVTQPSVHLVCRVTETLRLACQLVSFNYQILKQLEATFDEESEYEELKEILSSLNTQQTSICHGIPEEKLICWANRKNIGQIYIENFIKKVVFRERNCSIVMLDTDDEVVCRNCTMLLSTSSMASMGDQEYECPEEECGRTFKYQGALDKHILKHNGVEAPASKRKWKVETEETLTHIKLEPEVKLNEGEDHDFLDRLLDDMEEEPKVKKKKKKRPETKDFTCSDCNKAFYFQKNLFTHVMDKHGKSIDDLPSLAKVKLETEKGVTKIRKKYKRRLKGEPSKPVVCDECGTQFKFASGLYNHRKRMHGDIEKKQCPHCERLVKNCFLDQHIREEHGTPRYACQFCGKGFYYKSFMLNHQRFHTGEFKECICDLCGAVYKSVQVLNRHVRNAHQDLRNHKCTHCEKAFHNKQRLERHINSQHTKARVYPCPVCQTRYDRKDNLRTHIRKNHSAVVNPDTVELLPIENDGLGNTSFKRKPLHQLVVQSPISTPLPNHFLHKIEDQEQPYRHISSPDNNPAIQRQALIDQRSASTHSRHEDINSPREGHLHLQVRHSLEEEAYQRQEMKQEGLHLQRQEMKQDNLHLQRQEMKQEGLHLQRQEMKQDNLHLQRQEMKQETLHLQRQEMKQEAVTEHDRIGLLGGRFGHSKVQSPPPLRPSHPSLVQTIQQMHQYQGYVFQGLSGPPV